MPQGIKGWAIWLGAQAVLTLALKLIVKLADNALISWGDDKIAAWFGITSPDASTVFDWALPFVLAAGTLWLFHRYTTRTLKEALAQQGGGDRFSATGIVGSGSPPLRTWIQRVEPSHVIILGLAIAAIGAIWQMRQAEPRSTALQSQLDAAQKQIDGLRQNQARPQSATAPAPPVLKKYTAYEKEQRLRAVDELYGVIAAKLSPAYIEGRDLFNGLKNEIVSGFANAKLRSHYQTVESAFKDLNGLRKKYEYFPDIVAVTTENKFNGLTEMGACDNLINEIQILQANVPNQIGLFLDRNIVWMEARTANREFDQYLQDTLPRLKQKRTEIEASEVYSEASK
jgi:type II secretory pathway pseudopilin PulG